MTEPGRNAPARERALAALLLLALVLAWFPGLLRGHAISVADNLYAWAPWRADPPPGWRGPANKLLLDQVVQVYPWADLLRRRVARSELPLWNPHAAAGVSYLANQNAGMFSPFTLLLLLGPDTALGLTWVALARLVVSFFGGRALALALGASPRAAVVAGLGFAFSGPTVVWLGHPLTAASPLLPWSLVLAERVVGTTGPARRRAAAALGLVTAAQYLSGHPETALHTTLVVGTWIVLRAVSSRATAAIPLGALGMGLGFLAAAPQVLPFLDALERSYARNLRAGYPPDYRLPAAALPLALAPRLYGTPMELNQRDDLLGIQNFAETCLFVGVLPLVLVPAAGRRLWQRPAVRTIGGFAVLGLLIALDAFGLASRWLGAIPLIGLGAHQRLVIVWVLGLAVLAALALDRLSEPDARASRAGLAASVALGIGLLGWGAWRTAVAGALGPRAALGIAIALGALAGATALAVLAHRLGRARAVATALVLLAAELWWFGHDVNPMLARERVFPAQPSLAKLRDELPPGARVLALGRTLPPNTAAVYGLDDLRGYEPLYPDAFQRLWQEAVAPIEVFAPTLSRDEIRAPALLPLFAIGAILSADARGALIDERVLSGSGMQLVYASRTRLVTAWDLEPDPGAAGRRLANGYRYRERVLLDRSPSPAVDGVPRELPAPRYGRPSPERIELELATPHPAIAVVMEGYDPGWRALVDGAPAPVLRAHGAFLAVAVPAGAREVVLHYWPRGFTLGLGLSATALAGLLALAWPLRRPR